MSVSSSRIEGRQLEQKVAALAAEHQVPGVAVGTYQDGVETFVCHGVTSVENPLAVDERTLFQIGSTGKTFTATAVMRLVEQGRLDLDAPVRTYLPDFKVRDEEVASNVTVLQLLNHTAGWRGDYFVDTGHGDDALAKFIATLADLEQSFPLGTSASYNNSAVCTAGRIVEVLTGGTFEDAVADLVLRPLGLTETFYGAADAITRRAAIGHFNTEQGPQVVRPYEMPRSIAAAGASIVSSVRDQIAYARFHLGDGTAADGTRVLSAETLQRMQESTVSLGRGNALGEAVGISWLLSTVAGTRVVAHGGTTLGQLSAFQLVPDRDFAFTILTNSDHGGDLHRALSDWILETHLGLSNPVVEPLKLSLEELTEYTGAFALDEMITTVSIQDDHLLMATEITEAGRKEMEASLGVVPPDPPPTAIAVTSGDGFIKHGETAHREAGKFVRDSDGRITAMNLGGRLARRI